MLKDNTVKKGDTLVTLCTNMGNIKFVLYKDIAEKTCENFVTHCKNGYYDGVIFHRVMKNFMIQGGDPTGTGMGGESIWGEQFDNECSINAKHFKGALSMANSGPDTNGSQFFIVQCSKCNSNMLKQMQQLHYPEEVIEAYKQKGGTPWLDGNHTVFGAVVNGIEVVDDIANTKVNPQDRPINDIVIEKTIVEIA